MEDLFHNNNQGCTLKPHEARLHGAATSTPRTYILARTRELQLHSPMVTFVEPLPDGDRRLPIILDNHVSRSSTGGMLEQAHNLGVAIYVFPTHATSIAQPLDARDFNM